MKLMSFIKDGVTGFGAVTGDSVMDFSHKYNDLKTMLASNFDVNEGNLIPLNEVNFQPVIPNPEKIICVGVNYASHIAEMGREPGEYPLLFTRFANTQVGHNEPMLAPKESIKFDYEGELAVIIGKGGRKISENEAMGILNRVEDSADMPSPKFTFQPGELVRVIDGPFNDFSGVVENVNYEKSKLSVAVQILGRPTPVELNFNQVEKS